MDRIQLHDGDNTKTIEYHLLCCKQINYFILRRQPRITPVDLVKI